MSSYYVSINGQEPQPFSEQEILDLLASGKIESGDLVCQEGWADWQPIAQVFSTIQPPVISSHGKPAQVITTLPEIAFAISERPAAVKLRTKSETLLTREEFIVATAAQCLAITSPDGVVLTNRRIMLLAPQLAGLKLTFVDWLWTDVVNVHIEEKILGTTLSVQSTHRPTKFVERLDKEEARSVYRIAQQMEEVVRVGRHHIEMDKLRAGSAPVAEVNAVAPAAR